MVLAAINFALKLQKIKRKIDKGYTYDIKWQTGELLNMDTK